MENDIVMKLLTLKGKVPIKVSEEKKPNEKNKKKDDKNKQFLNPLTSDIGAINEIIDKKPKIKVVVEYLQDRVNELNEISLSS